jgi:O-antigen/teichoic acid export membrane protein
MGKISVPVLSEARRRNGIIEIGLIYRKSSINRYLIGLLIRLGVICILEIIFRILPPEYESGAMVIILFSITKIINVSSGVSQNILCTSSLYRYILYLMHLLIIIVLTNIILIPLFGIKGAAIAALISIFIYNLLTVLILYFKFVIWPYTLKHLEARITGIVIFVMVAIIPALKLIPDLIIRSGIIVIIFGSLTILFRLSEEASDIKGNNGKVWYNR